MKTWDQPTIGHLGTFLKQTKPSRLFLIRPQHLQRFSKTTPVRPALSDRAHSRLGKRMKRNKDITCGRFRMVSSFIFKLSKRGDGGLRSRSPATVTRVLVAKCVASSSARVELRAGTGLRLLLARIFECIVAEQLIQAAKSL